MAVYNRINLLIYPQTFESVWGTPFDLEIQRYRSRESLYSKTHILLQQKVIFVHYVKQLCIIIKNNDYKAER